MEYGNALTALFVLLGTVVSAVVGGVGYMIKALQAANDKAIAKAEAAQEKAEKERDTFRDLLKDAVRVLPVAVNNNLERSGLPAIPVLVPIVPISHSPTTPEQERQAEQFTALATIAAAKLALGLPPRIADPRVTAVAQETTVQDVAVESKKP
jgi:hypothetical protein